MIAKTVSSTPGMLKPKPQKTSILAQGIGIVKKVREREDDDEKEREKMAVKGKQLLLAVQKHKQFMQQKPSTAGSSAASAASPPISGTSPSTMASDQLVSALQQKGATSSVQRPQNVITRRPLPSSNPNTRLAKLRKNVSVPRPPGAIAPKLLTATTAAPISASHLQSKQMQEAVDRQALLAQKRMLEEQRRLHLEIRKAVAQQKTQQRELLELQRQQREMQGKNSLDIKVKQEQQMRAQSERQMMTMMQEDDSSDDVLNFDIRGGAADRWEQAAPLLPHSSASMNNEEIMDDDDDLINLSDDDDENGEEGEDGRQTEQQQQQQMEYMEEEEENEEEEGTQENEEEEEENEEGYVGLQGPVRQLIPPSIYPTIPLDMRPHVPRPVRQGMLDRVLEELLREYHYRVFVLGNLFTSEELQSGAVNAADQYMRKAVEDAMVLEQDLYRKCRSKMVYLNSCAKAMQGLRRAFQEMKRDWKMAGGKPSQATTT